MKGIMSAVTILFGLSIFSFVVFPSAVCGQGKVDLTSRRIDNGLLVEILNGSEVRDLKPPKVTDSNLFLRLIALGEPGDCAPGAETEVNCSIRYYLAVKSGDSGVPGSVFYLGEVGEISKIEWLKSKDPDAVRLRMEVLNYPEGLFEYAPELKRRSKTVELLVKLESVMIKDLR